jgi:hypothetical protein
VRVECEPVIEKLKQYPLVGLSLAIAAGYVLAHVIIETGDYLYENDPDLLTTLAIWTIVGALLSLLVWKRGVVSGWLRGGRANSKDVFVTELRGFRERNAHLLSVAKAVIMVIVLFPLITGLAVYVLTAKILWR